MSEEKRATIQINYKSRNSMTFTCEEFSVKKTGMGISLTWKDASPNPMMIGLGDIESIWEIYEDEV